DADVHLPAAERGFGADARKGGSLNRRDERLGERVVILCLGEIHADAEQSTTHKVSSVSGVVDLDQSENLQPAYFNSYRQA
ncbi:hypothetical protein, partial [Staphylococcus aureus]